MEHAPIIDRGTRRASAAVGGFAAIIRLVWVLYASRKPTGLSDPVIYLDAAESIATGEGYRSLLDLPTAYYPPGYPFFVAAIEWALGLFGAEGHVVIATGLVQALLGGVAAGAIVVTASMVGRRSGEPTKGLRLPVAIGAGVSFALWPNLVLHTPLILSESLFLATSSVLLAALCTWIARCSHDEDPAEDTPKRGRRVVSVEGAVIVVAMGLSTLVRPQSALLVLPAVLLAMVCAGRGWRDTVAVVAPVLVGLLVAVVPWTIRNAIVMDAFVPMSTNTGDNLCIGFHDDAHGGYSQSEDCFTEGRYVDGPAVEVARDAELRGRALGWIVDNPSALPALSWQKLVATFSHDRDAVRAWESYDADPHLSDTARGALGLGSDLYYWAIALASTIGAIGVTLHQVRAAKGERDPVALVVVALWASALVVPVLFFGDQRFKIPIAPAACILAALAVGAAVDALGRSRTPSTTEEAA